MRRALGALTIVAVILAACSAPGAGAASAPTGVSADVLRVWCAAHPNAVVNAGAALGIQPSRFVVHKAAVEQAHLDGNAQLAQQLLLSWIGQQVAATDSDPHPNVDSMPSWELDSPGDWLRSCTAAYAAK